MATTTSDSTKKNDLYSMTTFMPRSTEESAKRTPEDLEDELGRMRECSRAALSSSWADAERLRTEAAETETRIHEVERMINELKEEKRLRKDELVELSADGAADGGDEISADAKRASWFSWDDGYNAGGSSRDTGAGGGSGPAHADSDDDDSSDDSIDTEDLALIEKRFGRSVKSSASAEVACATSRENLEGNSTDADNNERRISWQRNLHVVGTSSARRRSSTVSFAGSLGRLDEDSVACADLSAGRLSLGDDTDSHRTSSGGKADVSLAAEERLMAQLSAVQAKMTDETAKLQKDIEHRHDSIERLQSSTKEQLDEITILKREYNNIQSSMEGENEVLKCEIAALQSQVNRLLVQDAALDTELKKMVSKITSAQERDQADEVKRLRAQLLVANENLKLARACTSAGPAGVQYSHNHGEEEEDGVHIDIDAVSDDMSAITAESFLSGGAPRLDSNNKLSERK